jgi:beta-glucosidase
MPTTKAGFLPANALDFRVDGDMEAIAAHTDFLGVNYYTRAVLKADAQERPFPADDPEHATLPRTDMGWEIYPKGLYDLLCRLHFEYGIPKLYITENGASYRRWPRRRRQVHDTRRIDYLRAHFLSAHARWRRACHWLATLSGR